MEKTNTRCNVKGTSICEFLGSDGCEHCNLNGDGIRAYQREELLKRWDVALSNLPYNADELHNTDTCVFCKGEHKNKAELFALCEFAHPEPETKKGRIMGLGPKVKVEAGTILQIPVSICKKCKAKKVFPNMLPWLGMLIGAVLSLLILFIINMSSPLKSEETAFPLIMFFVMSIGGYFVAKAFDKNAWKKHDETTEGNVFNTPIGKDMAEMGWFGFREDKGRTHVSKYSKKKPRKNFRLVPEGYVRPEKEEKTE